MLDDMTDDYRLPVSHNRMPGELRPLFAAQMDRIHLPNDKRLWPFTGYVAQHRALFASA
jgi:putative restriction endonuclease